MLGGRLDIDRKLVLIGLLFSTTIIFSVISVLYFDRVTQITEDYNTLSSNYVDIESKLKLEVVEKNDLADQLSKLRTDLSVEEGKVFSLRNDASTLEDSIDFLQSQKVSLQSEINNLNKEKGRLESDKSKLSQELSSEEEKSLQLIEFLEQFSNIPSTPAISDIDFKLYGGKSGFAEQIVIEYPNILISGVVGTGSMSPGISSQSMTIGTSAFNPYTLTPGQIIVYRDTEGKTIIHRIYSVKSTPSGICYEAKGDANFYLDPECIKPEQIQRLILGVLFRGVGAQYSYCTTELNFGPSSGYCPVN